MALLGRSPVPLRSFDVVAGYDPADPFTVEGKREPDYTVFLEADGLVGAPFEPAGNPQVAAQFSIHYSAASAARAAAMTSSSLASVRP